MTVQQADSVNGMLRAMQKQGLAVVEEVFGTSGSQAERALLLERAVERPWLEWSSFPSASYAKSVPVSTGRVRAEWVYATEARPDFALLYLHGGGFVAGNLETHRELCARISKATKMRCIAVDYRRAPEHLYPAQIEDSLEVYKWLLGQGFKGKNIAIAGDSAGSALTIALIVKIRELQLSMAAAGVLISPWIDLESKGDSMWRNAERDPMVTRDLLLGLSALYVGEHGDLRDPLASPIRADFRGFPPMLVQVGDLEVLLDEAKLFAELAKKASVDVTLQVWPGMPHDFQIFAPILSEGQDAIDKIGEFVLKHT